jgi:hypothetical protein
MPTSRTRALIADRLAQNAQRHGLVAPDAQRGRVGARRAERQDQGRVVAFGHVDPHAATSAELARLRVQVAGHAVEPSQEQLGRPTGEPRVDQQRQRHAAAHRRLDHGAREIGIVGARDDAHRGRRRIVEPRAGRAHEHGRLPREVDHRVPERIGPRREVAQGPRTHDRLLAQQELRVRERPRQRRVPGLHRQRTALAAELDAHALLARERRHAHVPHRTDARLRAHAELRPRTERHRDRERAVRGLGATEPVGRSVERHVRHRRQKLHVEVERVARERPHRAHGRRLAVLDDVDDEPRIARDRRATRSHGLAHGDIGLARGRRCRLRHARLRRRAPGVTRAEHTGPPHDQHGGGQQDARADEMPHPHRMPTLPCCASDTTAPSGFAPGSSTSAWL